MSLTARTRISRRGCFVWRIYIAHTSALCEGLTFHQLLLNSKTELCSRAPRSFRNHAILFWSRDPSLPGLHVDLTPLSQQFYLRSYFIDLRFFGNVRGLFRGHCTGGDFFRTLSRFWLLNEATYEVLRPASNTPLDWNSSCSRLFFLLCADLSNTAL